MGFAVLYPSYGLRAAFPCLLTSLGSYKPGPQGHAKFHLWFSASSSSKINSGEPKLTQI
jgi:hypothetical protein